MVCKSSISYCNLHPLKGSCQSKPARADKCIGRCMYFGSIEELLASLGDKRWMFVHGSEIIINKEKN